MIAQFGLVTYYSQSMRHLIFLKVFLLLFDLYFISFVFKSHWLVKKT